MSIHFSCTMCGRCCHDLGLPLSLIEAADWVNDGGEIQLFCEAIPWSESPAEADPLAVHKFRRSFPAMSGTLPLRVIVSLVAAFDGPCPHLQHDLRCGAYDRRPRVCRIYPAEINPFIDFHPSGKACPPEAWDPIHPTLAVSGRYVNPALVANIDAFRDADIRDVAAKRALCSILGHRAAALANEGFVIVTPSREKIIPALAYVISTIGLITDDAMDGPWTLISNRCGTRDTLVSIDACAASPDALLEGHAKYLGFHLASDN